MEWLATVLGQVGIDDIDKASHMLARDGLYAIIAVLLTAIVILAGGLVWLVKAKDAMREKLHEEHRQDLDRLHAQHRSDQEAHQTALLRVVESQATLATRQALLTEKSEATLVRALAALARLNREEV